MLKHNTRRDLSLPGCSSPELLPFLPSQQQYSLSLLDADPWLDSSSFSVPEVLFNLSQCSDWVFNSQKES